MRKTIDERTILEEWFIRRFERLPEKDREYFKEWVVRFNKPFFERCMDETSKKVWLDVIKRRLKR